MHTVRSIYKGGRIVLFVGLFALSLAAQDGSKDRVLGTVHDFNAIFHSSYDSCSFCHISHTIDDSSESAALALEWNHEIPANATYKVYSSAMLKTLNLSGDLSTANAFYSMVCLSCHDGSVAIGALYRMPDNFTFNTTTIATVAADGPSRLVGANNDLSQTHPVNFSYDGALSAADSGLWDVGMGTNVRQIGTTSLTAVRASLTNDTYGALQQPILFNGTIQCTSCHNPHSETNPPFLRVSVQDNKLCFKCHSSSARYDS